MHNNLYLFIFTFSTMIEIKFTQLKPSRFRCLWVDWTRSPRRLWNCATASKRKFLMLLYRIEKWSTFNLHLYIRIYLLLIIRNVATQIFLHGVFKIFLNLGLEHITNILPKIYISNISRLQNKKVFLDKFCVYLSMISNKKLSHFI